MYKEDPDTKLTSEQAETIHNTVWQRQIKLLNLGAASGPDFVHNHGTLSRR